MIENRGEIFSRTAPQRRRKNERQTKSSVRFSARGFSRGLQTTSAHAFSPRDWFAKKVSLAEDIRAKLFSFQMTFSSTDWKLSSKTNREIAGGIQSLAHDFTRKILQPSIPRKYFNELIYKDASPKIL